MKKSVLCFDTSLTPLSPLTHSPADRSLSCATGTSVLATSNFGDPSDTYNPYDEIPGDRPENLYDEIHPRSQVISTIIQDNFQSSADTTRPPTLSGK